MDNKTIVFTPEVIAQQRAICDAATPGPDSIWISVKERLPDMCGCKCLVAAVNDFCQANVFTAHTGYMERGKLEFHSCETQFDLAVWHITHWMPLPKLPEVEG